MARIYTLELPSVLISFIFDADTDLQISFQDNGSGSDQIPIFSSYFSVKGLKRITIFFVVVILAYYSRRILNKISDFFKNNYILIILVYLYASLSIFFFALLCFVFIYIFDNNIIWHIHKNKITYILNFRRVDVLSQIISFCLGCGVGGGGI